MSDDDDYDRKKGRSNLKVQLPEAKPEQGGSDNDEYQRNPRRGPQPLPRTDVASPEEKPLLNLPLADIPPAPKNLGDGPGSASKDVVKHPSEYDHSPMPTLGGAPAPEQKNVQNMSILPETLKVRTLVVNIICYLNILFLLVYFGCTV
jgi:hypothetical protein